MAISSTRTTPAKGRRDPEARKSAIIWAASEIIVENGPGGLTHRSVAKRAGVSLGSTTQYFSSLDELRELALNHIAAEIDDELNTLVSLFENLDEAPEQSAANMAEFLNDPRQVKAEIALLNAGTIYPDLREVARRWFDRLVELLSVHIGEERANAIAIYLDCLTIHAGLHRNPINEQEVANTIRVLATMPCVGGSK